MYKEDARLGPSSGGSIESSSFFFLFLSMFFWLISCWLDLFFEVPPNSWPRSIYWHSLLTVGPVFWWATSFFGGALLLLWSCDWMLLQPTPFLSFWSGRLLFQLIDTHRQTCTRCIYTSWKRWKRTCVLYHYPLSLLIWFDFFLS